tara:strand:+ start:6262 stop:6762 length:501 start_codon:yes stop_codon:yes gene_type:complete
MTILIKNKDTLICDDFEFKCSIGKMGKTFFKKEGDLKTPKGSYSLGSLFYRSDRKKKPKTRLNCIKIKKTMGWCDDINSKKKYNNLINININIKIKHEKLFKKEASYDYFIVINYNKKKTIVGKGSAIFIHLTKNYKKTEGCIALKENDFLILAKLINKKTKIKIF